MTTGVEGRTARAVGGRTAGVPDRLWLPAIGALVLALSFAAALLVRTDGDVSLLVHAAPPWSSAEEAPGSLTVQPADEGFDGQFFYRLGVEPWTTEEQVAGVTNDLPSLRNARWGYGALAWVASAGDEDLVPWSLLALNVAAMAVIGAVGGALARSVGRHAGWGLLFALWPGFAYSLSMDTSELVASALVLGGLLALRRRRWLPAAALFAAAVITRDTTAVVPAGVALGSACAWLTGRFGVSDEVDPAPPPGRVPAESGPFLAGVVPLVFFVGWQLVQRARFGELPLTSSGDNNLSAPFGGLADQLGKVIPPSGGEELFRLVSIAGLLAVLGAAAWSLIQARRTPADLLDRWIVPTSWILSVAVVAVLNAYLWSGATAFMRAATEAGLLSTLAVLAGRGRRSDRLVPLVGIGLAGLWLLTAVAQLSKLG